MYGIPMYLLQCANGKLEIFTTKPSHFQNFAYIESFDVLITHVAKQHDWN